MRTISTAAVIAAACMALLAATACGSSSSDAGAGGREGNVPSTPARGADGMASAVQDASVSGLAPALRAVRTAERSVGRGNAYDIESDRLRGRRVWEVKVARGTVRPYEIDVSADGRQVLRRRRESKVGDDVGKVAKAKVSLERALRIAGRRAGGARFDEAEIDRWRGRLAWEATFKRSGNREVEVRIDARSGKVLAVSVDD